MSARLNPLDEGHRPSGLDDTQWAAQVSARRRDLLGALAETVLDRRLSPLEHTAVDIALAEVVRSEEQTSELQSLTRISYAVLCSQKQIIHNTNKHTSTTH